jgi:hypothetical protein
MIKVLTITCCIVSSIWSDNMTDQMKCQMEANYMLAHRKLHHVGPTIGNFEGIGWSQSGQMPKTCVPQKNMRPTGDAIARGKNIIIRVRSWR